MICSIDRDVLIQHWQAKPFRRPTQGNTNADLLHQWLEQIGLLPSLVDSLSDDLSQFGDSFTPLLGVQDRQEKPALILLQPNGQQLEITRFQHHAISQRTLSADKSHALLKEYAKDAGFTWYSLQIALPLQFLSAAKEHHLLPVSKALQRMWRLLSLEKKDIGLMVVYALASGCLALATPIVLQNLVNTVAFAGLLQPLVLLSILLGFCLGCAGLLHGLEIVICEAIQRRMMASVAIDFARRIPWMSNIEDQDGRSKRIFSFFEAPLLDKAAASLLISGLDLVLQAVIGVLVLAFYHPMLLIVDIFLVLLLVFVLVGLGQHAIETSIEESNAKYEIALNLQYVEQAALVRHQVDQAQSGVFRALEHYLQARQKHFVILMRQFTGTVGVEIIISAILFGIGGWLVIKEELSLGQLVAAEVIVTMIINGVSKVTRYLDTYYGAVASVYKLSKQIDIPLTKQQQLQPQAPLSMGTLQTPLFSQQVGRWLLISIPCLIIACLFLPWQQTSSGYGRVVALAPIEREQFLTAPVEGRIETWHVTEGTHVQKGELLVTMQDNDASLPARIEGELKSLEDQLHAARLTTSLLSSNVRSMELARGQTLAAAQAKIRTAQHRLEGAGRTFDAAEMTLKTANANLTRQRALAEKGLVSTRQLEQVELTVASAWAEMDKSRQASLAIEAELLGLEAEQSRLGSQMIADIERAKAAYQQARSSEAKLEAEILKTETKASRQAAMAIMAPRDGTLVRVVTKEGGSLIKSGEALAVFVPDTLEQAVELWINSLDAPLLSKDRQVRLQFEGWPAVQFIGWPQIAIGTFAGRVQMVDATSDNNGKWRVVIVPEEGTNWPASPYLRQGVRVHGWILLNEVSLGFELWRLLNQFPILPPEGVGVVKSKSKSQPFVGGEEK